jgi:hypothetical protein
LTKIEDEEFFEKIAISTGKSVTMIKSYFNLILDYLFKEMLRGNSVRIHRFATFTPKLIGGVSKRAFGKQLWVDPRVNIQMSLTKTALVLLNKSVINEGTKTQIRRTELTEEEREMLVIPKRKPLREVLDKILAEREEERQKKLGKTQNDETNNDDDIDEMYDGECEEDEEDV